MGDRKEEKWGHEYNWEDGGVNMIGRKDAGEKEEEGDKLKIIHTDAVSYYWGDNGSAATEDNGGGENFSSTTTTKGYRGQWRMHKRM